MFWSYSWHHLCLAFFLRSYLKTNAFFHTLTPPLRPINPTSQHLTHTPPPRQQILWMCEASSQLQGSGTQERLPETHRAILPSAQFQNMFGPSKNHQGKVCPVFCWHVFFGPWTHQQKELHQRDEINKKTLVYINIAMDYPHVVNDRKKLFFCCHLRLWC